MIKYNILNRWSGEVKFTAEIDCEEGASIRVKMGLAVKWAIKYAADLTRADLTAANLTDADLTRANLTAANLTDADLTAANLTDANLTDANLTDAKNDFMAQVLKLPNELESLRDMIIAGKIDGSVYSGACSCLAGTLAEAHGLGHYNGENIPACEGVTFEANASSPRERFFTMIRPGNTPDNNAAAKIALKWTNEAIAIRDNIVSQYQKSHA